MIIKVILDYFGYEFDNTMLILDAVLLILVLMTRDYRLILVYFLIVILTVILEYFFRQCQVLSNPALTDENIKLMDPLILRKNIRLEV